MAASHLTHNITKTKNRSQSQKVRSLEKLEISLDRIRQELLNKALKHSAASEIQAPLMEMAQQLVLTVEDNGKGMAKKKTYGHGLLKIKTRPDYLHR